MKSTLCLPLMLVVFLLLVACSGCSGGTVGSASTNINGAIPIDTPSGNSPRYFDQSLVPTLAVPNATIGTTYYIDSTNGSDSWNGMSPTHTTGTNGPFKTIGYATGRYSGRLVGGNVFKIKAGIYRERLQIANATGNIDENHRIIIGPYGDGEVIIDASDTHKLSWTVYSGNSNIYVTTCDFMIGSSHVAADNVILDNSLRATRPVYKLSDVTSYGKWFYDDAAKKLYVYTGTISPTAHDIIVTLDDANNQHYGIDIWTDYTTLYGLTVRGAGSYGFHSYYGYYTTIENCTMKFNGKSGFKAYHNGLKFLRNHVYANVMMNWPRGRRWNYTGGWPGAVGADQVLGALFSGNIIHDNGGEGIVSGGGNGNSIIEDNISYDNWSVNLYIETQGNSIMRRNVTYRTPVDPSDIVSADDPTVIATGGWISYSDLYQRIYRRLYPTCMATSDEPQSQANSDNNKVYDNIAIGCFTGIEHVPEATGSKIKDYTIANNTIIMPSVAPPAGATWRGIALPYSNGLNSNTVVKNNIIVNTRSDTYMVFLGGGANEHGITLDNNLYYNPNATIQLTAYEYPNNANYALTTWKSTMTGQDVHSMFADPKFAGGANPYSPAYYVPTSLSPALGMGATISGYTTDFNYLTKAAPWTVGALEH